MGIWFSNLVELIKIKVAVSCVNWELQVNSATCLGKDNFVLVSCSPWWIIMKFELRELNKVLQFPGCQWLGVAWNRDARMHARTQSWPRVHGKHPGSLGLMPGHLACSEKKIFRNEKSLPYHSLIIIALCCLISLAILKSMFSTDPMVLKTQRHGKLNGMVGFVAVVVWPFSRPK